MFVILLGLGCGTDATVTAQGASALKQAELVVGSKRLCALLPSGCAAEYAIATEPRGILRLLLQTDKTNCCVVYSGDTGFYSGARLLLPLLREAGIEVRVLPGISSLQAFAAKLERPWQDWLLFSAHGQSCDVVHAVCMGKPVFFLTGGAETPASLCRQLTDAGLGGLSVAVGENLFCADETVFTGTAEEAAGRTFAPLSVLLAEPAPRYPAGVPGIPDALFLRGNIPMTKQEVRAAALAKLAVKPGDMCWDIGAGTGSVSVELALQTKAVWAVEREAEACALVRENRKKFGAWNLCLAEGEAPGILSSLPKPDAVFVGGSGGNLPDILRAVHAANPCVRICVSAIALETLTSAREVLEELGFAVEVAQISVSRAKTAGELHLLLAQNPVFLISGAPA